MALIFMQAATLKLFGKIILHILMYIHRTCKFIIVNYLILVRLHEKYSFRKIKMKQTFRKLVQSTSCD